MLNLFISVFLLAVAILTLNRLTILVVVDLTVGVLFITVLFGLLVIVFLLLHLHGFLFKLGTLWSTVLGGRNVLTLLRVVKLVKSSLYNKMKLVFVRTYFFHVFKVEVRVLNNVKGLISEDFTGVCLENGVELFGEGELLSVFGRHFK